MENVLFLGVPILKHIRVSDFFYYDRALTPRFGHWAGAFRTGKSSVVLTKIGENTMFYA